MAEGSPIESGPVPLLVAGMAHDLNNVMTAILAHLGLLELRLEDLGTGPVEEIPAIGAAVGEARSIVNRMVQWSRGEPVEHLTDSIAGAVTKAVALARAVTPPAIELSVSANATPASIMCDGTSVIQIVTNLLANARESIDGTGRISVETRPARLDELAKLLFAAPRGCTIVVGDTGRGIAPDDLTRIFAPYFSRREGGNGLGLYMVSQLVARLRGVILVESHVGQGTTFRVVLPAGSLH